MWPRHPLAATPPNDLAARILGVEDITYAGVIV
jgi:hypothetical protein